MNGTPPTLATLLTAVGVTVLVVGLTAPVLGVGLALVVVGIVILWRTGLESLAWWTAFLTPFQAAFVIDVGITLRLAFLAGIAMVSMAAIRGRMGWPAWHPARRWLAAFLALTVLSTVVMTPFAPAPSLTELSGLRGVPFMRPILQSLQLASMVAIMLVVARLAREPRQADVLLRAMVLSGLVVSAYGLYMFMAPLVGIPAVDINNAMNTNFTRGAVEQGLSMGGVRLPRVRSTFVEPLHFANYLLVVMAGLWATSRMSAHSLRYRVLLLIVLLLFVVGVNSRGAMLGAAAAAVAGIVYARAPLQLLKTLLRAGLFGGLVVAAVVLVVPLVVAGMSVDWLVDFFVLRIGSAIGSEGRVWQDLRDVGVVWMAHPLFGVGFGNLPFYLADLLPGEAGGVVDAGSLYTRVLAETGLVGLLTYLGFLVALLWGLVRTGRDKAAGVVRQTLSKALYFVIVADAIQRLANVGIATDVHLWILFGLALGVCCRPQMPTPPLTPRAA